MLSSNADTLSSTRAGLWLLQILMCCLCCLDGFSTARQEHSVSSQKSWGCELELQFCLWSHTVSVLSSASQQYHISISINTFNWLDDGSSRKTCVQLIL